jgi:hypothetical protein
MMLAVETLALTCVLWYIVIVIVRAIGFLKM